MTGPEWDTVATLVELVRRGDRLAQADLCGRLYGRVFGTLLQWARWLNSEYGSPVGDSEIQVLAHELAAAAFMSAFDRIAEYDASRASFLTYVCWRGKALMNGIVKKEIIAVRRHDRLAENEDEDSDQFTLGARPLVDDVEKEVFAKLGWLEIEEVLASLPSDQARAIIEVWIQPRTYSGETQIGAAARRMGRSAVAMDSLLRRATRNFRRLWGGRKTLRE